MDLKAHIGEKVRAARSSSGMTQESFAEALARSTRTISAIESGQSLTSLSTLEEIAAILKKPLSYFFVDYGAVVQSGRRSKTEHAINATLAAMSQSEVDLALVLLRALRKHASASKN